MPNDGNSTTPLHFLLLPERAIIQQATPLALRVARMANAASVLNQIDVQGKMFTRRNERREELMRLFIATLERQEFQAAGDAKDVGVYGKDRLLTGKEQDTTGGLGADAFEGSQKGDGFKRGEVPQEGQIQSSTAGFDFLQNVFDDHRFDVGKAAGLDGFGNRGRTRPSHLLPFRKAFFQAGIGTMAVHVGRGLRKDGGNKFVEWVKVFIWRRTAIDGLEILGDVVQLGSVLVQGEIGRGSYCVAQRRVNEWGLPSALLPSPTRTMVVKLLAADGC